MKHCDAIFRRFLVIFKVYEIAIQFPRGRRHGEAAVSVQGVPQADLRLQGVLRRHQGPYSIENPF